MKTFKDRFEEMYQKTEPEKHWRAELDLYEQNGQNQRLPYHNGIHVMAVLRIAVCMRKMLGLPTIGKTAKALEIAAVFHDLGHSGGPDISKDGQGRDNIERALEALMNSPVVNRYPEHYIEFARELIEFTRYPHGPSPTATNSRYTPDEVTTFQILRDADCMWALLPRFTRHVVWSLSMENNGDVVGSEAEVDWDARGKIQKDFLSAYTPGTSVGRALKNAHLETALAATDEAIEQLKGQRISMDGNRAFSAAPLTTQAEQENLRTLAMSLAAARIGRPRR